MPGKINKKTHIPSKIVQDRIDSFNFDKVFEKEIEKNAAAAQAASATRRSMPYVLDSDRIQELMAKTKTKDLDEKDVEGCIQRYQQMTLLGFEHTTKFCGLFRGCTAQIQMQLEGTRAMALASLEDVAYLQWTD